MKIQAIYIALFLGFIVTGCSEDFLENPPMTTTTDATYPTTESDALLVTNAAYSNLRNWWYEGGYPLADIMSDDQTKGSEDGSNPDLAAFEKFTYTPSHAYILAWYQTLYQSIRHANIVIEQVPPIDMDTELKDRYVAEARFLRAYTYFNLVRLWGDIPKVISVIPERTMERSPAQEIYDEIILPDLLHAADILPEQSEYASTDLGRASRGAAKAMLARVYLHQGDFLNAEKYALEVYRSREYKLDPDFTHLFTVDGQFGDGSVFELGAMAQYRDQGGNQFGNTQGVRGDPDWGWGFGRPSWNLLNSFEADDPRMDATVVFLGEVLGGTLIMGSNNTSDTTFVDGEIVEIECYNQKVQMEGATNTLDNFGHNRRLIRYADVLLMAAEALNENNNPGDALLYLEEVRNRARDGNPAILPEITETNKDLLREIIWEERRHELALETYRFFDLQRQGRMAEVLDTLGFVEGKHEMLPFPQSEIDLSEGKMKQSQPWL